MNNKHPFHVGLRSVRRRIAVGAWLGFTLGVSVAAGQESVNLLEGKYQDQVSDLYVKVLGHRIEFQRVYLDGTWRFPTNNNLVFKYEVESGTSSQLTAIVVGGDQFSKDDEQGTVFSYGSRKIFAQPDGFRMTDTLGNWHAYDPAGHLLRYGDVQGRSVQALYDGEGRLAGYQDHFSNQVLWLSYNGERISSVSDQTGAGRSVQYFYAPDGNLTNVVDVRGYATAYGYDITNRLIFKREPGGREIHVVYNSDGTVASLTDQDGAVSTFTYNYDRVRNEYYAMIRMPSGKVEEKWFNASGSPIRRAINGQTIYPLPDDDPADSAAGPVVEKDANGNVTRVQNPDGTVSRTEYDSGGRPIREVNELGVTNRYVYDTRGNLLKDIRAADTPLEQVADYAYDTTGNRTSVVWRGDAQTPEAMAAFTYDDRGNVTSVCDPEGHVRHRTYDSMGNILTETDALGFAVSNRYDAAGNLVEKADPVGQTYEYVYDATGNQIRETKPGGETWVSVYDANGRLVQTSNDWNYVVDLQYDLDGNLVRTVDSEGRTVTYEYDLEGRVVRMVDEAGEEHRYAYDAGGRRIWTMDPGGMETTVEYHPNHEPAAIRYANYEQRYEYDDRDRLIRTVVVAAGETNATTYTYDAVGNLVMTTDAEGHQTKYTYDLLDRPIMLVDARGFTNQYGYDGRDNMIWHENGNGHRTAAEYDRNGRWTRLVYPGGAAIQTVYDARGDRVRRTDPKGQSIEYDYDGLQRITQMRLYAAGAGGTPAKTIVFAYDAASRLTNWAAGSISAATDFDVANHTVAETVNYGTFSATQSSSYDIRQRCTRHVGPDGVTNIYSRDAAGRINVIQIPGQGAIACEYNYANRITRLAFPGGVAEEVNYDALSREISETLKDPAGNTLLMREYSRNRIGWVTQIATDRGHFTYAYDGLGQLISEVDPVQGNRDFIYDGDGNRGGDGSTTNVWVYNELNQLVQAGASSYEYDANGNLVREAVGGAVVREYEYDIQNQLIAVRDGAETVLARYEYDPLGRRIKKEAAGQVTWYAYADEGLAAEFDGQGQVIRSYGHYPAAEWGSLPLYLATEGRFCFFANDRLGTPLALVESSGGIAWSAAYEAFGRAHVDAGASVQNPLRGSAQYEDPETGFHYNTLRYYHPDLGRYSQRDPLEAVTLDNNPWIAANPLTIPEDANLYRYASNSPINQVDVLGLFGGGIREGEKCKGHGDFPGYGKKCKDFDWNLEDNSFSSNPFTPWGLVHHFRPRNVTGPMVRSAIQKCDKEGFVRAMHQYQDFYVHYSAGWRWYTAGHLFGGHSTDCPHGPGNPFPEWDAASAATSGFLSAWNANCCDCCMPSDCCVWVLRRDAVAKCGGCK